MILNIRGGSGAGKSTVMRSLMDLYKKKYAHHVPGRKQPLWYDLKEGTGELPPIRVLGHYEAECGGCDTISKNPEDPEEKAMVFIHRMIREAHEAGINLVYEGVILTTVDKELIELIQGGMPLTVINLTSDLDVCLGGISERRARKTGGHAQEIRDNLAEKTIKNNVGKLRSAHKTASRLKAVGATVFDESRDTALDRIVGLLS
jgi:energy-coupling factor transporter ATP-binding protein EcfA2